MSLVMLSLGWFLRSYRCLRYSCAASGVGLDGGV